MVRLFLSSSKTKGLYAVYSSLFFHQIPQSVLTDFLARAGRSHAGNVFVTSRLGWPGLSDTPTAPHTRTVFSIDIQYGKGEKREESDPHDILQIIRFKSFFIIYRHHNEMLSSEMQKNSLEEIHKPNTLDTDIISSSNCNFAWYDQGKSSNNTRSIVSISWLIHYIA